MQELTREEEAAVRAALARGQLTPQDVEAARDDAAFQGGSLVARLRARLRPIPSAAAPAAPAASPAVQTGRDDATVVDWATDPRPAPTPASDPLPGADAEATAAWTGPVPLPPPDAPTPVDNRTHAAVSGERPPEPLWRSTASDGPREGWVGEYQLVRELARGGMGVVYVARSAHLDREVALKMLLPTRTSEKAAERFRIEARAAARLRHPNVVGLHHVGDDAGRPYMVMDLIQGRSLVARLEEEGPLPLREAAYITSKLADAMAYAHQRSILHRDLKPHNVLLDAKGEPMLTDFGVAKEVDGAGQTLEGEVVGTPAYMPPEQAGGNLEAVDRRADVYSLGATLYHMLTGQAPFDGEAVNVIVALLRQEPPRPRTLRPDLDLDLETICLKCLEKEPERRYRTMSELGADLQAYLEERPISARPPTVWDRLGKWRRRNTATFRALVAAGLLLAVGSIVATTQTLRMRAGAARREAEAAVRERQTLADAAQESSRARTAELAGTPLPAADAPDRDAVLAARTSRALRAYVAAQRWHGLAPEAPAARAALFDAACALGEVNAAARQWLLALQAYEEAQGLGLDDARARALATAARAAWDSEREAVARDRAERARVIEEVLAAAAADGLQRGGAQLEQAVYRLVRAARADVLPLLLDRLARVVDALQDAERAACREALTAGGAPRELIDDVDAAVRERTATTLSAEDRSRRLARWGAAAPYLARTYAQRAAREELKAAPITLVLGVRQTEALGAEVQVARVLTAALAQLSEDPRVPPALTRYLRAENDLERATRAAVALCLAGDVEGARATQEAMQRFGGDSALAHEVRPLLAQVEGLLEAQDDTLSGYSRRASILSGRGDGRGALAVIDEALARFPDAHAFRVNRAVALRLLGQPAAAAAECTRVLELLPGHPAALYERAFDQRALRQLDLARQDLEALLGAHPEDAGAWLQLAAVRHAAGDLRGAVQAFDRCLALDPEQVEALANRAMVRLQLEDQAGAEADVEATLRLAPRNVQALSLKAELALEREDVEGAIAAYTRAIDAVPDDAHLRARRAAARLDAGDVTGARVDAERALALDPASDRARRVLARLDDPAETRAQDDLRARYRTLREAGDRRGALAVLREVARAAPDDLDVVEDLATLALDVGQVDVARPAAERLVRDADARRRGVGHRVRARLLLGAKQLDAAAAEAALALAAVPDDAPALDLAGLVRYFQGDYEAAVAAHSRAVTLAPRSATFVYNRGTSYIAGHQAGRAGWRDLARADFERALELDPELAGAWGNLGMLRAEVGDVDGAIAAFERCLALAPDHPMAGRTRQLVAQLKERRAR
jgi:tetratricopeptide (TPR) repeat protein